MDNTSALGVTASATLAAPLLQPQTSSGQAEASLAALPIHEPSEMSANVPLPPSTDAAQSFAASMEGPVDTPPEQQKDPVLEAFEVQYAAVIGDPRDFNKLVGLISAAEKLVSSMKFVDHLVSSASFCLQFGILKV